MFNLIFVCHLRHGEIYYYLLLLVLLVEVVLISLEQIRLHQEFISNHVLS